MRGSKLGCFQEFEGLLSSEFGHILLGLIQAIKRGIELFVVTSIVYQQKLFENCSISIRWMQVYSISVSIHVVIRMVYHNRGE